MQRVVNFRGGEQLVQPISLDKIVSSHNPRRPCPRLQRKGIVPLDYIHSHALSDDVAKNREYAEAIVGNEPRIVSLFLSIDSKGQIEPAILRGFRSQAGKDGDKIIYEERAGFICGERRGVACSLGEAIRRIAVAEGKKVGDVLTIGEFNYTITENTASTSPYTLDAIVLSRITVEEAHELALDENEERQDMNDLDWGREFDRMLKSHNPATSKPYTIKEVAEKRRRHNHHTDKAAYHWVRTRAALVYLPDDWQAALENNDGKLNIVEASTYALKCKARAMDKLEKEIAEAGDKKVVPVIPDCGAHDGHKEGLTPPTIPVVASEPTLSSATKSRKRQNPLSRAEIESLFDSTPLVNEERLKTLAEVLQVTYKEALKSSKVRKEEEEAKLARQTERNARRVSA